MKPAKYRKKNNQYIYQSNFNTKVLFKLSLTFNWQKHAFKVTRASQNVQTQFGQSLFKITKMTQAERGTKVKPLDNWSRPNNESRSRQRANDGLIY